MFTAAFLIVAVVLFALSIAPSLPGGQLRGAGLAFFAGSFLVAGR